MSELSAKILRHIADLHEAGIVANQAKVDEEYAEWKSSKDPVECADLNISMVSSLLELISGIEEADFPSAISKNKRRLAWMRQHQDPTKTPLELWQEAKRAERNEESEHE